MTCQSCLTKPWPLWCTRWCHDGHSSPGQSGCCIRGDITADVTFRCCFSLLLPTCCCDTGWGQSQVRQQEVDLFVRNKCSKKNSFGWCQTHFSWKPPNERRSIENKIEDIMRFYNETIPLEFISTPKQFPCDLFLILRLVFLVPPRFLWSSKLQLVVVVTPRIVEMGLFSQHTYSLNVSLVLKVWTWFGVMGLSV